MDDELYRKSRQKAAGLNSSVTRVLREYLLQWTAGDEALEQRRAKLQRLFAHADSRRQPGPVGRFDRDSIYASRLGKLR